MEYTRTGKNSMPKTMSNHLKEEKSPYLKQHADNPVDWHPWGEEAFEKARSEDKPVFLSIGYATCHWCHVMAHESFEDPEVAALMNDTFVNIKVDREERPDIDHTYMLVCQMIGGQGGWPLNVILTPDRSPFYATTYVPREGRHGRPGMTELVPWIGDLWKNEREKVNDSAGKIAEAYRSATRHTSSPFDYRKVLEEAWEQFRDTFDEEYGGFGRAPKFPSPHNLMFLLRYWKRTGEAGALEMVTRTLSMMRKGGIYDHIGYGFHRYSTDRNWLLPHFEKMLYDQGLLMIAYAEAWQITGNPLFRRTVLEVAEYLDNRLKSPEGVWHAAEDADSSEGEGVFYTWTVQEIRDLLPEGDAELAIRRFRMEEEGNFTDEATGRKTGANLPHLAADGESGTGNGDGATEEEVERIRSALHRARDRREHPPTDRKILTDWNGLAIAALAKAGNILGEETLVRRARDAAGWILEEMRTDRFRLWHRYVDGERTVLGNADDYAYMIWGLLELYEATLESRFLEEARGFQEQFDAEFGDPETGGYYFTSSDEEVILERSRELYDGAMPSANSVAVLNLLRMGRMTGDENLEAAAERTIGLYSEPVERAPTGFSQMLQGLEFLEAGPIEVIIAGGRDTPEVRRFRRMMQQHFIPARVVLLHDTGDLEETVPFLEQFPPADGRPTFYICRDYACRRPVHEAEEAIRLMEEMP